MMKYDITLFKGTAEYYAKYRPGYPKEFFQLVMKKYKLNGIGRLLDLGTGTGKLAIPFSKHFERVVAMDPDKKMLGVGKKIAKKQGIKNIDWVIGDSESLDKKRAGIFRLVVMGRSFHWMRRHLILRKLYGMTQRGGGVVIVADHGARYKWNEVAKQVIREFIGPVRHAGLGTYRRPPGTHEKIFSNSPFQSWQKIEIPYKRFWTVEKIVKYHHTTSFASKYILGKKAALFEKELGRRLRALRPKKKFIEQGNYEVFLLFKK